MPWKVDPICFCRQPNCDQFANQTDQFVNQSATNLVTNPSSIWILLFKSAPKFLQRTKPIAFLIWQKGSTNKVAHNFKSMLSFVYQTDTRSVMSDRELVPMAWSHCLTTLHIRITTKIEHVIMHNEKKTLTRNNQNGTSINCRSKEICNPTPTKRSNAQHLVEYVKQLLQEENQKSGNIHAIAYAFLRLWYKFEVDF